jgi:hypothetical protein
LTLNLVQHVIIHNKTQDEEVKQKVEEAKRTQLAAELKKMAEKLRGNEIIPFGVPCTEMKAAILLKDAWVVLPDGCFPYYPCEIPKQKHKQ